MRPPFYCLNRVTSTGCGTSPPSAQVAAITVMPQLKKKTNDELWAPQRPTAKHLGYCGSLFESVPIFSLGGDIITRWKVFR